VGEVSPSGKVGAAGQNSECGGFRNRFADVQEKNLL